MTWYKIVVYSILIGLTLMNLLVFFKVAYFTTIVFGFIVSMCINLGLLTAFSSFIYFLKKRDKLNNFEKVLIKELLNFGFIRGEDK